MRLTIIYKAKCSETDKFYIGSTYNLYNRKKVHKSKDNKAESRHLINPTYTILKEFYTINRKHKHELEQEYMDLNKSDDMVNKFRACGFDYEKRKLYNQKYNEDHQKERIERDNKNREKIRARNKIKGERKVNCPKCNKEMRYDSLSKHLKKKVPCV